MVAPVPSLTREHASRFVRGSSIVVVGVREVRASIRDEGVRATALEPVEDVLEWRGELAGL
jgi:hypothetical protein